MSKQSSQNLSQTFINSIKILLTLTFLIINFKANEVHAVSFAPVTTSDIMETYNWTKTIGGTGTEYSYDTEIDSNGNVYMTGKFAQTVDFDSSPSVDEHTSTGAASAYITKINADSSYAWTITFMGTGSSVGNNIAFDSKDNIYLVGWFADSIDFDPSGATDERISAGGRDVFVTKINSDGSYGWTKSMGGTGLDTAVSISIDLNDNVFLSGTFENTVDFDFSGAVDSHTSSDQRGIFVTKINSDSTYAWTRSFGGTGTELVYSSAVDSSGSVYSVGYFYNTVDFDPTGGVDERTSLGVTESFINKINSDGSYGWTKIFTGTGWGGTYSMLIDSNDNIYTASSYSASSVDFDPSSGTDFHTNAGNVDFALTMLGSDGSYGWTESFGGTGTEVAYDLGQDSVGNFYISGYFSGTGEFDPSGGTDYHASAGGTDAFLTRLNSDRSYGWTKTFGSTGADWGDNLVVDSSGNIFLSGYYSGTVDFDSSSEVDSHTSAGGRDIFLTKISADSTILSVLEDVEKTGTLTATDLESDPLIYSIVEVASHGTVTFIDSTVGTFTYTPDADYFGEDSFTFKVNDGFGDSNISTITVDILNSNNDAPEPTASNDIVKYLNTSGSAEVDHNDPDGAGGHSYEVTTDPANGSATISAGGFVEYTPDTDYLGSDSIEVTVTDSDGLEGIVVVNVTITAIDNTAPVANYLGTSTDNVWTAMNWDAFTEALSDVTYRIVFDTTNTLNSDCSNGTEIYSGTGLVNEHINLINGTTYYYMLCGTDGAGNVSVGVGANMTPPNGALADGISFAGDDTNENGFVRVGGGDDSNNLDTVTDEPINNLEYEFKIVVKDGGASPPIVTLYISDRAAIVGEAVYTLTCTGDHTLGTLCTYPISFGPASANDYHFAVSLDGGGGGYLRYPASGKATGPSVSMLNGYNIVSVARNIDGQNLVANDLGCSEAYRWVSGGLSRTSGNKGAYELIDGASPLKNGEGYFVNRGLCGSSTLTQLPAEDELLTTTYEITLQAGWNIISNPYNGDIFLSDVQVQRDSETPITWTEAVSSGWAVNGIYSYDGSDWGLTYNVETSGGAPDARLTPWLGYWIYLSKDDATYKLILPQPLVVH